MSSEQPSNNASTPQTAQEGPFARFRRTLSTTASEYLNPSSSRPDRSSTTPLASAERVAAEPTAFQRFMSLGKTRKDWDVDFPPHHWISEDTRIHPPEVPEVPRGDAEHTPPELEADEPLNTDSEPITIARRIRSLLSRMPLPPTDQTRAQDLNAPPPPEPAAVSDPKLVALLSCPSVMNGMLSKTHESVWSALDRLRAQLPGQRSTSCTSPAGAADEAEREEVLEEDDSGVMIYGPLLPNADSEVELAESETVPANENAPPKETSPERGGTWKDKLEGVWPFKNQDEGKQPESGTPTTRVQLPRSKKVWIPSPDKISVQVMWWGYRIYLPPPVLDVLDNKQIEGAKRAAMLTTALKWLLDKVPLTMLPPQARPTMTLLKAFTPYLAYVGGFVAWSWSTVKRFDKGNGVTLTATWLLTIAVIPGTWEDTDFPQVTRARGSTQQSANESE